jgi:hypothetical protein
MPISKECGCPELDLERWDNKIQKLDAHFYSIPILHLFYAPAGAESKLAEVRARASASGYHVRPAPMRLIRAARFFGGRCMIEVTEVGLGDPQVFRFAGAYPCTVHRGAPRELPKLVRDMHARDPNLESVYLWQVTCPRCAPKDADNVTILIAETLVGSE